MKRELFIDLTRPTISIVLFQANRMVSVEVSEGDLDKMDHARWWQIGQLLKLRIAIVTSEPDIFHKL